MRHKNQRGYLISKSSFFRRIRVVEVRKVILIEAWKCFGEVEEIWLTRLFNKILMTKKMPDEWSRSVVVPIYKNEGDIQNCTNYRGIKLMSHTMKLWE